MSIFQFHSDPWCLSFIMQNLSSSRVYICAFTILNCLIIRRRFLSDTSDSEHSHPLRADRASKECALNFLTRGPVWLSLMSVWHVPARYTLGLCWITACFYWSAGPHIWATCVFETVRAQMKHVGRQKCCVCSRIPVTGLTGSQTEQDCRKRNMILGIIWWTFYCLSFIFHQGNLDTLLLLFL